MKALKEIKTELKNIFDDHVIVGASVIENGKSLQDIASSIHENLDCVIHVLQRNTDGSVHNGLALQVNESIPEDYIENANLLHEAIEDDLKKIPGVAGVYFTKTRANFLSPLD